MAYSHGHRIFCSEKAWLAHCLAMCQETQANNDLAFQIHMRAKCLSRFMQDLELVCKRKKVIPYWKTNKSGDHVLFGHDVHIPSSQKQKRVGTLVNSQERETVAVLLNNDE